MTVAVLVVLSTRSLAGGILDGARRASEEQARTAQEANGRRRLSLAVAGLDVASPGAGTFRGARTTVAFSTWLRGAYGAPELRTVRLFADRDALWLMGPDEAIRLLDGVKSVAIDYLLTPGAHAAWAGGWTSASAPPQALRFRLVRAARTDTLLLLVGERG